MNLFFLHETSGASSAREPERRQAIFLIAAALHIILFSSGFYGISGDESGRTLDTVTWMRTGKPQSDVWLPLHRILVAAGLSLFKNYFAVPRILSFLFGLASLLGLILFARELFHRRSVTVMTALLAAVFGPHVVLSVVPLTELEFITFMVFAMMYYVRWIRSAKPSALLAASVFAALGTTVRYEAWIFVFVFLLLLVLDSESRKAVFSKWWLPPLVILITCAFPICWTIDSYFEYHVFLVFVSSQSGRSGHGDPKEIFKLIWRNPATQFIVQNGVSLNLLGIIPVIGFFKRDKQIRRFLLLPAIALIVFGAAGLAGVKFTTHNPWRVAVLWSCLMLPFRKNKCKAAVVLIIIFMFLCQLAWLTQKAYFTQPDYDAGIFLRTCVRPELEPGDRILIDTRKWDYLDLLVVSNEPELFVLNSGPYPDRPEHSVLDIEVPVDLKYLAAKRYRYLAFGTPLLFSSSAEEWTIYRVHSLPAFGPAESRK